MYDTFCATVKGAMDELCCFSTLGPRIGNVPQHFIRLQARQKLLWENRNSVGGAVALSKCSAELKRLTEKYSRNRQKALLSCKSQRDLFSFVSSRITYRRKKTPVDA